MFIELPVYVNSALAELSKCGYEAYVVGGCVRDSLAGRLPGDWDICTNALPSEISGCFKDCKVIDTGIEHGTVTVVSGGNTLEITTFRIDGEYSDNRHPDRVEFVGNLKADLGRRDFTINAMAYSPRTGLVDYYGGRADLKKGLIRCVGNAERRFQEDALRILRALRFASVFSFSISEETSAAMLSKKELLRSISAERVSSELNMLIAGAGAGSVLEKYADILFVAIPELEPSRDNGSWDKNLKSLSAAPADIHMRLAILLRDILSPGKEGICGDSSEIAAGILKRLRYDNETIKRVKTLVRHSACEIVPDEVIIKKWLNKVGVDTFRKLIGIKRADMAASGRHELPDDADSAEGILEAVLNEGKCFSLSQLSINGSDLIKAGISEGRAVGSILGSLLDMVINGELPNSGPELLKKAIEIHKNFKIDPY